MKEGWEYKTLGEICKIYNGNSINADYKKKHFLGATGGLPFIATKDVSPLGTIDYNNGVRIPNYEEFKVAPANSVFICAEGGSAGKKFAYVEKDVCFGNKLFCITPKDKAIKGKFIYHFVQSDNFRGQFFSLLTGLIGGVSAKKFQTIEIPIPSLSEQQSIVDYLDSAFAKIDAMKANAEKSLNEANALFQTSLKEMLEPKEGWEEKKLGDIAEIKGGKRLPKGEKLLSEPTGHKYIRVADFNEYGTVDLGNIQYISDEVYEQIKRYIINKEDIYISIAGTIGKSGIIPEELDGANLTENACRLILSKEINQRFMYYATISPDFIRQETESTKISAQPKLALTRLADIIIAYPPIVEQQRIVATLDTLKSKVDRLQANFEKISQECDALKQAILRQVFE